MSMENQPDTPVAQQPMTQRDDETNLMDLLLVIAKHNRFILKLTGGAAFLAVVVSLLLPNVYTGKAVVQTPQQGSSSASMLLGQLGGLAGAAGGALGIKNPSDLYVGMLKSRTVADALVLRFKLQELYGVKTMSAARSALGGATVIAAGKDGFITIEYSDKDPKLAAAIANAYVEELDGLAAALAAKEALGRKAFYEKQLKEVREDLGRAELEMKTFQEKNRVFRLGGEGAGGGAPGAGALGGMGGMVLGAAGGIPTAELEYVRIARDVKSREMLLGAMAQQVAAAKIDAAKDVAVIQVLDKALPPDNKSKPKRALIVLLTSLIAMFMGVCWAFFREAAVRARQDPEQAERINLLRRYFRQGR